MSGKIRRILKTFSPVRGKTAGKRGTPFHTAIVTKQKKEPRKNGRSAKTIGPVTDLSSTTA
jgi:hypothetical protein